MSVANGYCTLAELRTHIGDSGSNLSTELLERAINATSRAIDKHCGRRFWLSAQVETRVYRPDDAYTAWVDDIGTSTGLVVKTDTTGDATWATTWASTDYQLEPLNVSSVASGDTVTPYAWWQLTAIDRYTFPVHPRRTTLQVTAKFGWSSVPVEITSACLLKSASLFKRREAPFGVAGIGDFGPVRIGPKDYEVRALLDTYIKIGVGAV